MPECVICGRVLRATRRQRYPDRHARCERDQRRAARVLCRRLDRALRLMAGVEVVAAGGRYADAADAARMPDPFTFSNACLRHMGARPRVLAREIRRSA